MELGRAHPGNTSIFKMQALDIGTLVCITETLESIVCRCFGPNGGQVLFTKATGEILIVRDGKRILESLLLDHPVARMIVECVSAHCSVTGDGAKSFILLLSALLRGFQAVAYKGGGDVAYQSKNQILKQFSYSLLTFHAEVLDQLITQQLNRHFLSVFSINCRQPNPCSDKMESVLDAFFCGKIGDLHRQLFSRMAYSFFNKCVLSWQKKNETLKLICDHFLELHTSVRGLPVACSNVLQGLVLHRDFTVYCPADGNIRIVVVTEAIQPALSSSGSAFVVDSDSQLQASKAWATKRVEEVMTVLHKNKVKLLLSSIKQSDAVIYYAKLMGISLVECLTTEEIFFFCYLTGISPLASSWDVLHMQITDMATATLCKPLLLGPNRYVHLYLSPKWGFKPHCLLFCGPVQGLIEQYVAAFHSAFKMLNQLFGTINSCPGQDGHKVTDKEEWRKKPAADKPRAENSIVVQDQVDKGIMEDSHGPPKILMMNKRLKSSSMPITEKRSTATLTQQQFTSLGSMCQKNSAPDIVVKETCEVLVETLQNSGCGNGGREVEGAMAMSGQQFSSIGYCKEDSHFDVLVETSQGPIQYHSQLLIQEGSVLPAGGAFEFLLHFCLQNYVQQCQNREMKRLCQIVADALLTIPKNISSKKASRHFLQVYTQVMNSLKAYGQLTVPDDCLESVSCKYHLLASVFHCVIKLVVIDSVIGVKRIQNTREEDSEDCLQEEI
nr:PREDICTED: Bardet-Biedl syndrome 10 protein isoform X1 [Latimeria chalumnae]|eukprot:XP_014353824.1 PREDICTED: Bardet-Biedl syndrome 10 protein isoform X1 [Latimeria chalumnae]